MRRIGLWTLALLPLPVVPAVLLAQQGQPGTVAVVAVVNVAKVFDGYRMTKDLEQRFEDKRRAIGDEAENRRKTIEQQLSALEAFDPASADYTQRREEVLRLQAEYRVWLDLEEARLKDEHMAWLREIYERVRETVAAQAQKRGLDLVVTYDELSEDIPDSLALRREILLKKVIYFHDRVDLTAAVQQDLNTSYNAKGGAASLSSAPPARSIPHVPPPSEESEPRP